MFHVARPTFQIEGKLGDEEEESPLGVINTCTEIRDIFLISEVIGDKDWNDERDAYRGGWRNRFIPLLKMINGCEFESISLYIHTVFGQL